jgi:hypothetical protein
LATTRSVYNKPGKQYDTVIMMDCSQCPIHPQLQSVFHDTARKHAQSLVKAGIRPVLFMSWAYKDRPEMTSRLAEEYTVAGNANDALVIPAGLAFANAICEGPGLELYADDKRTRAWPAPIWLPARSMRRCIASHRSGRATQRAGPEASRVDAGGSLGDGRGVLPAGEVHSLIARSGTGTSHGAKRGRRCGREDARADRTCSALA